MEFPFYEGEASAGGVEVGESQATFERPCPYAGFVPKPSNPDYVGTAFMAVREQEWPPRQG